MFVRKILFYTNPEGWAAYNTCPYVRLYDQLIIRLNTLRIRKTLGPRVASNSM